MAYWRNLTLTDVLRRLIILYLIYSQKGLGTTDFEVSASQRFFIKHFFRFFLKEAVQTGAYITVAHFTDYENHRDDVMGSADGLSH